MILLNDPRYPGPSHHQYNGQGYGQPGSRDQGHAHSGNHRQGQNQNGPHYPGLHGHFVNQGDPQRQTSQRAHISSQSSQSLLPAVVPPQQHSLMEVNPQATSQAGGGFSLANQLSKLPNLTEIKGFVDRMGGIDGILTTVTKVQKVVSSVTQMAPMVKVLFGSFGKKSASSSDSNSIVQNPRRRRRRRSGSGTTRPRTRSGRRRGRNGRRR